MLVPQVESAEGDSSAIETCSPAWPSLPCLPPGNPALNTVLAGIGGNTARAVVLQGSIMTGEKTCERQGK